MKLMRLVKTLAYVLRNKGVSWTVREGFIYLFEKRAPTGADFDEEFGVDTAGDIHLWEFDIKSENAALGTIYQPTGAEDFERALQLLPNQFDPGRFIFIDLGCGKGKTLMLAARHGFKALQGVEFAPELIPIAAQNMRRWNVTNSEILCMDAAEYQFPNEPFVLYLFNPFQAEVLKKVVDALRAQPIRDFCVIYNNPRHSAVLREAGFLSPAGATQGLYPIETWRAPEFCAGAGAAPPAAAQLDLACAVNVQATGRRVRASG